ncbi:MAG: hypothetical protein WEE89_06250 [Gemmatimonadota bacterium]
MCAVLLGVAACQRSDTGKENENSTVASDSTMPGMSGMAGMQDTAMMAGMTKRMEMMRDMSGDSLEAMMPEHRQMAGNMLSEMSRQMREMNMTADAAWMTLTDSIRADLTRIPDLTSADLQTLMHEHGRRLHRLMEMHTTMMTNMRM